MADNVVSNPGSGGATFASDDIGGVHYPRTKVVWGADGAANDTAAGAAALPIQDGGNSLTVDGTVSVSGTVTVGDGGGSLTVDGTVTANAGTGPWPVTDNGGSLTVDGSISLAASIPAGTNNIGDVDVLTVPAPLNLTGGGVEANALRVTIASDSTGVLSVDDNGSTLSIDDGGGAITVDGTVTAAHGLTLKRAVVSLSASGNVVAAVASNKITVYQYAVQSRNDSMTFQFTDGNGGPALGLRWTLNAREGAQSAVSPPGWIFRNANNNTAIYGTITGTGTVDVEVSYWEAFA